MKSNGYGFILKRGVHTQTMYVLEVMKNEKLNQVLTMLYNRNVPIQTSVSM